VALDGLVVLTHHSEEGNGNSDKENSGECSKGLVLSLHSFGVFRELLLKTLIKRLSGSHNDVFVLSSFVSGFLFLVVPGSLILLVSLMVSLFMVFIAMVSARLEFFLLPVEVIVSVKVLISVKVLVTVVVLLLGIVNLFLRVVNLLFRNPLLNFFLNWVVDLFFSPLGNFLFLNPPGLGFVEDWGCGCLLSEVDALESLVNKTVEHLVFSRELESAGEGDTDAHEDCFVQRLLDVDGLRFGSGV
jgi:hypothetical protein